MSQSIRATVAPTTASDDLANHTITIPTGLAAGDIVMVMTACDDGYPNLTWPAGSPTATTIVNEPSTDWPNCGAEYVGPLSSSDATTLSGGTITCGHDGATMAIIVLVGATNTIDFVTPSGGNYDSSTSQSITSATTTDGNEIAIAVFNGSTNTSNSTVSTVWSTPSGWTNLGTGWSSYESLGVFYKTMPSAGAIGATASSTTVIDPNKFGSFAFAFRNSVSSTDTTIAWFHI